MSEIREFKALENEEPKMKTLANCKASEFLKQTFRMKEAVEQWLKLTDVLNIMRKTAPQTDFGENMTEEEKAKVIAENVFLKREQFKENILDALKAVMYEYPEETVKILGMCCFIEPEDADNYSVAFYLNAITGLIEDKAVVDFFISLARLGQKNTSDVSKA